MRRMTSYRILILVFFVFTLSRAQVFASAPAVYTDAAGAITSTSATLNGRVDPSNSNTLYYFFYGTSETSVSRTALTEVLANSGLTAVHASISNLQAGTEYYFQLVAYNSTGTTKGNWLTFTTSPGPPTVSTKPATNIALTSATLNGTVNPGGDNTWYHFYYGQQETGGASTSSQEVTAASGLTTVSQGISGLQPGTLYYFQTVASNSSGQVQGTFQQFTTANMTIDFSPRSFDFGTVNICDSVTQTLYIVTISSNSGDFRGTMLDEPVGDFTFNCTGPYVQGCSIDVPSGENTQIATVTFHPTMVGTQGTDFRIVPQVDCYYQNKIYREGVDTIRISVSGTGQSPSNVNLTYLPASPYSFGDSPISLTNSKKLTIQKPTNLNCDIYGQVYGSDLSAPFSIAEGNLDFTLTNAKPETTVTLNFSPTSTGTFSGSFHIEYNVPNSPTNSVSYSLSGTGVSPSIDGDYILTDENADSVYLLRSGGSTMTLRKQYPSILTPGLSFVDPSGAVIVNGSMYIAEQGNASYSGAVYKINVQSDEYSKLPFNNFYGNFYPHDIQWIWGQLYILRQNFPALGGINSLIISDTNATSPVEIRFPPNICGSPTRLVDIGDTLYLTTYSSEASNYHPCVYFFSRASLADNNLDETEVDSISSNHAADRIIVVTKGINDTLDVWNFAQSSGMDTLSIYWHRQLCRTVAVQGNDAPYILDEGGGSFFLLRVDVDSLYQFSEYRSQPIGIGSAIFRKGGVYLAKSTLSVQSGTIGPGTTTTYSIGGHQVASIQWSTSGTLPQSVILSYYDRTYPPGSLTGHYADAYWTVDILGGTGYTYDLTLDYDSSLLNNITNEGSIIAAQGIGNGKWMPVFSSSVDISRKSVTLSGLSGSSALTVTATDTEDPLPATVMKLAATQTGKSVVTLNWTSGSEVNVAGFKIIKKTESDSSYQLIASYLSDPSLVAAGMVTSGKAYDYVDSKVLVGVTYDYEVIETSKDGIEKLFGPIRVAVTDNPTRFGLDQNYPNPFNPSTTISYQLPVSCHVVLDVYNNLGQKVETLVDKQQTLGNHSVVFDGSRLASGGYLYRLQAGSFVSVKKMLLVK